MKIRISTHSRPLHKAHCCSIFFFLVMAWCYSFFCFFLKFYSPYSTFILSHSYSTFIRRHSIRFLSWSLVSSVGKTSLRCRAEYRTRACLIQQADALPTELRRTLFSILTVCFFCRQAGAAPVLQGVGGVPRQLQGVLEGACRRRRYWDHQVRNIRFNCGGRWSSRQIYFLKDRDHWEWIGL